MTGKKMATSSLIIVLLLWASLVVALGGTMAAVANSPHTCRLGCHEMYPFYQAWKRGPHKNVACGNCHVGSQAVTQLLHTFPAMKQVVYKVQGKGKYPLPESERPMIPPHYCKRCHTRLSAPTAGGFQHALHSTHECTECHWDTGHSVTVAALQAEGVYSGNSFPARRVAHMGSGAANVVSHKRVACSNCHDMGSMGCVACHTAQHKQGAQYGTDCTRCHQAGARFVFAHPAALPCTNCHITPADHGRRPNCTNCHLRPGVSWAAAHPSAPQRDCETCHVIPPDHDPVTMQSCAPCHRRAGITWIAVKR